MTSKTKIDNRSALLLCLVIVLFMAGGCAKKPWNEYLGQEQGKAVEQVFCRMRERDATYPRCVNGDAVVSMQNHLESRSLSSYFQCMLPNSIEFVASNPLGQPLFAVTTDGIIFTTLDTSKRTAMSGRLVSYALLHGIPPAFFSESWGEWLTGRVDHGPQDILTFRTDSQGRGTWISFRSRKEGGGTTTHLLIDIERTLLLTRIIEDRKGQILAEINYGDWKEIGGCLQPALITMRRLAFGGELSLRLTRLQASNTCGERDFILPIPSSYSRQLLP